MYRILVINPGSTSTKLAIFEDSSCILRENLYLQLPDGMPKGDTLAQIDLRTEQVERFLHKSGFAITDFDMLSVRCGAIPPAFAQIYTVNQLMVDVIMRGKRTQHPSGLACLIASRLTGGTGIPMIAPNAPSSNEMDPIARICGIPDFENSYYSHVLNSKECCRVVAEKLGIRYEDGKFIVAHLGGGSSITAHRGGRIFDLVGGNTGPMSTERAGTLPAGPLAELCYSGKYTLPEMMRHLFNNGGFAAFTGTNDALEMENRAKAGDKLCAALYTAMAYQVAKSIGEFYVAQHCGVDAIIITGSLARSEYLTDQIMDYIRPLCPVIEIIPGEREMEALAAIGLSVLRGETRPVEFNLVPEPYATVEAFYAGAQ